jgi:HK97 family phage prohead protease
MSDEHIQVAPYQRCAVQPEVKAHNDDSREVLHLISTNSIDRAGDVVEPGGAGLENFLKNPVVMRNHSYLTQDIIGRATSVTIDKDGIWARTAFRDTEVGREAHALSKEGLGGWSIGFRPVKHESIEDDKGVYRGIRFKEWELLEYSQVPIPMNQDAVQSAVQRGLVSEANVPLFFNVTEPKQAIEPEKPADEAAPSEANVEPAQRRYDTHPAMLAIARVRRSFERDNAAQRIAEAAGNTP